MLTSSYLPPFRALLPRHWCCLRGQLCTSSSRYRGSQACTAGNVCTTRPLSGLIRAMRINRCNPGAKPMIVWSQIGGWRAYAKEIKSGEPASAKDAAPASDPHTGHHGEETMMPLRATHAKLALSALGLAVLTGCASVSPDQNINRVNDEAGSFTGASCVGLYPG